MSRPVGYRTDFATRLNKYIVKLDCWVWIGERTKAGYGLIGNKDGSNLAHRWVFEHYKGKIPKGLTINHLCRNVSCVNPDHLEAVTLQENISKGFWATKTFCKHGHSYNKQNTYIMPSGGRDCRQCINRRAREYKIRKGLKTI